MRAEHIGLAVQRLNHSATSSVDKPSINVVRSYLKHVLEPYVQSVVTVWLYMINLDTVRARSKRLRTNHETGARDQDRMTASLFFASEYVQGVAGVS